MTPASSAGSASSSHRLRTALGGAGDARRGDPSASSVLSWAGCAPVRLLRSPAQSRPLSRNVEVPVQPGPGLRLHLRVELVGGVVEASPQAVRDAGLAVAGLELLEAGAHRRRLEERV